MSDPQITILYIDDNPTNRYVVRRHLEGTGFRVTEADSGEAGLRAIAESPPDLVILDVRLPDISGFEVCQQLKENPSTANIPVLHLSAAYTRSQDRAQGLEQGADAYLVQPVEAVELLATIHALLRLYRAEQTAQRQSQEWQTTFDAMSDGVCLLDANGRVLRCNRAIQLLLNQSSDQLRDRHYFDLVPLPAEPDPALSAASPNSAPSYRDRFTLTYLQDTGQRVRLEVPFQQLPEDAGWVALTLDAILNEVGTLTGAVYIATDITLQKRVEVERERLLTREQEARTASETANRLKDDFLATLSHELRSPLNAILGWTSLLKNRPVDPGRMAQALEIIERNTRTQTQLIEDLLDVSRIIQGKLGLNIQPTNLVTILNTTLDTVRPAVEAKGINLQLTVLEVGVAATPSPKSPLPNPKFEVLGDRDRLQQIVWNLLSNAVKFTPNGGRVDVQLDVVEGDPALPSGAVPVPSARITVTDTGKGIAPAFLPHVFDRFRQADSSITRQYGGLGLGLSIVRHLVELHGGTVAASSPGEGLGATFVVQIPILSVPQPSAPKGRDGSPEVALPSLAGLTILVVDDEDDSRSYISTLLELQAATVIPISSTQRIVQILEQSAVDVLVSDIGMPHEDGYSLMRRLRSLVLKRVPPAISLTGYARSEDREAALAVGFQAYLTKPVEPQDLITAIARLARPSI
jgi:signal transduction histidine kinase/CheY-like chemotaxis protein